MVRLIPRDATFYPMFGEQVAVVSDAARALERMLRTFERPDLGAAELRELEHHGDELNHRIAARLEQSFVTPFGREEIHDLAGALDEVLDRTEEAADLVVLYNLDAPPSGAADQADVLVRQASVLEAAVAALPAPRSLRPFVVELHRLEKKGDQLVRSLIQRRFDEAGDVRVLPASLDVHRMIESAVDSADHAGQVIERVGIQAVGSHW